MSASQKRSRDQLSPPVSEVTKRYNWCPPDKLVTQNRYYPLSTNEDSMDIITQDSQNEDNESKNNNGSTSNKGSSSKSNDSKKSGDEPQSNILKIPPIFLRNATNHNEIINDIKALTTETFTTAYKNTYLKINLTNANDYRTLTKYYKENKVEYHTFQDPNNKPLSVVIRNVPISLTDKEIEDELKIKKLPIIKVTRLLNKSKHPMPLCAVELTATDNAKEIFNVNEIFKAIVTVEPRKRSSHIPQCHNCQRYGHTKNYCALQPRCVKCGEGHSYINCKKKAPEPPKCANCGDEHPSNYRGCKTHKEIQEQHNRYNLRRQQNVNHDQQNQSNKQYPPRITHSSYATATKTQPSSCNNNNLNSTEETNNNLLSNLPNPSALSDTILNFLKNLITPLILKLKSFIINELIPNILNA